MARINLSDKSLDWFVSQALVLDEFIPLVLLDRASFARPRSVRLVQSPRTVTLSDKLPDGKRIQTVFSLTCYPGALELPFEVVEGASTWDDDGFVCAAIDPQTANVSIRGPGKQKAKHGDRFTVVLDVAGSEERQFRLEFHASDNEDDFNRGEYKDVHCGRVDLTIRGTSRVGARLISNIDSLPPAPPGYMPPPWNTNDEGQIALSQQQANQYSNCGGVCYATTESRAQRAYIDELGVGVVDLSVSSRNIDHRIAATYGTNDPFMGYGAGGPFARHGRGEAVNDAAVWAGDLRAGALLQLWHSTDPANLYANGGHSVIFRNYVYDDNGEIEGLQYSDYNGGRPRTWLRSEYENQETILGVNLLD